MIVIIISCLQMALCSLFPCLPFFLLLLPLYALSLRRMLQCLVLKYYLLLPCVYIMWGTYKCHRAHILVSWQFWGNHFTPTVNFRFRAHFFQLKWKALNRHLLYSLTLLQGKKSLSPLLFLHSFPSALLLWFLICSVVIIYHCHFVGRRFG